MFAICFPDLISRKQRIFPSENSPFLFLKLSAFRCQRGWQARSGKLLKSEVTKELMIKMKSYSWLRGGRCTRLRRFGLEVYCLGFLHRETQWVVTAIWPAGPIYIKYRNGTVYLFPGEPLQMLLFRNFSCFMNLSFSIFLCWIRVFYPSRVYCLELVDRYLLILLQYNFLS